MVRYFVIAARNRSDLYAYLKRQFWADDKVQVLLDRRHEERRRRQGTHDPERRRGDRRSQRGKDDWLHYYGLLIVRHLPEVEWQPVMSEQLVGFDSQPKVEETKAVDARDRVIGWLTQGQHVFSLVPKLLQEHGHLTARSEAAERKCERFEQEIRSLRSENEYFRKERRQIVETLKALAKHVVESAGEPFQ